MSSLRPKSQGFTLPRAAGGFTLIELLVVITIIAVLAALITPAYFSVRRTAFELAIANDLKNYDGAIEKFRDEFGFYPSDFSEFVAADGTALDFTDVIPNFGNVTVEQRLLQFLAKISPTHNENSMDPVDTMETRLGHWWHTVGQVMVTDINALGPPIKDNRLRGPQHALWFWLSELHNDAQYPITGQRLNNVAGSDSNGNGTDDSLEIVSKRRVFFDFEGGSLEERTLPAPIFFPGGAVEYKLYRPIQRRGDGPVVYFHNDTFIENTTNMFDTETRINFTPLAVAPDPLSIVKPVRVPGSTLVDGNFLEPKKFQIITPGWDERFGEVNAGTYESLDNLCNFGEGRLDSFVSRYTP